MKNGTMADSASAYVEQAGASISRAFENATTRALRAQERTPQHKGGQRVMTLELNTTTLILHATHTKGVPSCSTCTLCLLLQLQPSQCSAML
jgi:hypothetical protein